MDGTSKKWNACRARLPEKKRGLIGARNGCHWGCLVDQEALPRNEALNRTDLSVSFDPTACKWLKRSGSTVNGRNQVDPSLCFLVHPANEALIERHCGWYAL